MQGENAKSMCFQSISISKEGGLTLYPTEGKWLIKNKNKSNALKHAKSFS